MAIFDVQIRLRGKIIRLRDRVLNDTAVMHKVMQQWSKMYAAYTQRRFATASKGGSVADPGSGFGGSARTTGAFRSIPTGPWKPLSPRTASRRRPGRRRRREEAPATRKTSILVDTGLLRRSLNPGLTRLSGTRKSGPRRFSATISFGSDATYMKRVTYYDRVKQADGTYKRTKRTAQVPSGVTVREVMGFHQSGDSRRKLPQRKIVAHPDARTLDQMADAARRIINEHIR